MWYQSMFLILLTVALIGCGQRTGQVEKEVPGGDPVQGRAALVAYGCGTCHRIPGIPGAEAEVGPPLAGFEQRHYIAGELPNTADNLILWLQDPQSIAPGTAMPDLDVTATDARHMAAYLFE